MALSQEAINDAELAKAKVANANHLDNDYKRNLINLINISTTATNGISQEEKIQQMTEAVRLLAISQIDFMTSIKDTISTAIAEANIKQCSSCKAMKHASDVETEEQHKKLIDEWKKANNIVDKPDPKDPLDDISWQQLLKKAIQQPMMWIFLIFVVISPYTLSIVKAVFEFFGK